MAYPKTWICNIFLLPFYVCLVLTIYCWVHLHLCILIFVYLLLIQRYVEAQCCISSNDYKGQLIDFLPHSLLSISKYENCLFSCAQCNVHAYLTHSLVCKFLVWTFARKTIMAFHGNILLSLLMQVVQLYQCILFKRNASMQIHKIFYNYSHSIFSFSSIWENTCYFFFLSRHMLVHYHCTLAHWKIS